MNLQAIAAGAISAINPMTTLIILISSGYQDQPDGHRTPVYKPPIVRSGQVQPLTTGDIRHVESLNLQGVIRSIFINGTVNGLVRVENKGGDLIILPDGRIFLVNEVPEQWEQAGWSRAICTLQDQKATL